MIGDLLPPARVQAALETAVTVLVILIGLRLALSLAIAILRRTLRPDDPRRPPERQAQIRTLVPLLESALRYIFYFTALVMILDRLGLNVVALLASAGIVGIAVGFGAQPLIRDVIAGFFLLFEGLIQVGDVVRVGDTAGEVERISLRTTQVRKFSGELVTIPNGQIQQFGNMSRGFMRAVVQVGVAHEADLERVMTVMHRVGREWAEAHPDQVLAPPEVQGILGFDASEVPVRLVVMVAPRSVAAAEQELRRRLKVAFDAEGIEAPYPRQVVYLRGGETGPGPAGSGKAGQ
jgi:small conductance mechanosensitive channel